jgi:hypothetical protein
MTARLHPRMWNCSYFGMSTLVEIDSCISQVEADMQRFNGGQ